MSEHQIKLCPKIGNKKKKAYSTIDNVTQHFLVKQNNIQRCKHFPDTNIQILEL